MLFGLWPLEKVTASILEIEENLASGVDSISHPIQGAIKYQTADEAKRILRALYRRYGDLTGERPSNANGPRILSLTRRDEY